MNLIKEGQHPSHQRPDSEKQLKDQERSTYLTIIKQLETELKVNESDPEILRHSDDGTGRHKFRKAWFTQWAALTDLALIEIFGDDPLSHLNEMELSGEIEQYAAAKYGTRAEQIDRLKPDESDVRLKAIKEEAIETGVIDHEKVSQIPPHPTCERIAQTPFEELTYQDLRALLDYFMGAQFKKKPLVQKIDVKAGKKAIRFAISKLRQEIESSEDL